MSASTLTLPQLYQSTSYTDLIDNNRVYPEWGCNPSSSDSIATASNSSCGNVKFSQACVNNSVHGGGSKGGACITGHMARGSASMGVCIQRGAPTGIHLVINENSIACVIAELILNLLVNPV